MFKFLKDGYAVLNLANAIVTPNFELHLDEAINPNVKKILLPRNRVPKKPFAVIRSQSISQYNAYLLRKFFARRKPEDIMGYHECVAENNTLPSECEYIVGHLIIEDDQFIIPKNMSYIKGIYGCLVITNTTLRAEDLRFLTRMQSDNQPCGTYFAGIRNNPHLCPIKELAMINDFEEHSFCKMKADEGKRAWIWYVLASLLGVELLTLVIIGVVAYFHYQYLVKYWTEAVVPQAVDFTEYLIDCYECEERASKKENLGLLNEKRTQSISDRHRHHEAYKYKDEDHKKKLERGLKQWRRIRKAAFILFFLSTTAITLFGTYAYVHVYVLQKT